VYRSSACAGGAPEPGERSWCLDRYDRKELVELARMIWG
jgi:hypothetical protein